MSLPSVQSMRELIDSAHDAVEASKIGPMFREDELGERVVGSLQMNVFMTLVTQGSYVLHHPNCHEKEKS